MAMPTAQKPSKPTGPPSPTGTPSRPSAEPVEPKKTSLPRGVEVRGALDARQREVFSNGALELVADLVRRFGWRVDELLARRRERQARFDAGERPDFLAETAPIRSSARTGAPLP